MESAPLILFDGQCGFCHAGVQRIIAMDRRAVLRFCPMQSELGQRLLRLHGLSTPNPGTLVLIDGGRALVRSGALVAMARHLGGLWLLPALLGMLLPRGVCDALYDVVAANRYRFMGQTDACVAPTDELRRRFVAA